MKTFKQLRENSEEFVYIVSINTTVHAPKKISDREFKTKGLATSYYNKMLKAAGEHSIAQMKMYSVSQTPGGSGMKLIRSDG